MDAGNTFLVQYYDLGRLTQDAVESFDATDHLPVFFFGCPLDNGPDHGIQTGTIPAAGSH